MVLKQLVCEGVDWICLTYGRL